MKKLLAVLLILTVVGGVAVAQAKYKVGVSMPSATHGWMANANWWANKAKADWEARDKTVTIEMKFAGTAQQQAADIEDLLVKKINAIVVFPFDTSVTSVVEKAFNQGVYVVVLDRGVSKEGIYDVYITNDDEAYTRKGMEWLAKQMNYKGNLLLITGIPSPIDTIRTDTIKTVVEKYPNIKLLDVQPGDWNRTKSTTVMENYLQKYKQVDAVYTADDDMMLGAMQAYKESGRTDIKLWLGGGCLKDVIKGIMDGKPMMAGYPLVQADVTYSPSVIATSISYAVIGVKGDKLNPNVYQVRALPRRVILPSELVTKENAKDVYVPAAPFA
jgi:ribose transport system substrate-binding protein